MSSAVNRVLSLWKGERNVGVISTTDSHFVRKLKSWAREAGYRVQETGRGEKEEAGQEHES